MEAVKRDAQYFIDKFSAIPEELWCTGTFFKPDTKARCTLGHCGKANFESDTHESAALQVLFVKFGMSVIRINDAGYKIDFILKSTPRQRVLEALEKIKAAGG